MALYLPGTPESFSRAVLTDDERMSILGMSSMAQRRVKRQCDLMSPAVLAIMQQCKASCIDIRRPNISYQMSAYCTPPSLAMRLMTCINSHLTYQKFENIMDGQLKSLKLGTNLTFSSHFSKCMYFMLIFLNYKHRLASNLNVRRWVLARFP